MKVKKKAEEAHLKILDTKKSANQPWTGEMERQEGYCQRAAEATVKKYNQFNSQFKKLNDALDDWNEFYTEKTAELENESNKQNILKTWHKIQMQANQLYKTSTQSLKASETFEKEAKKTEENATQALERFEELVMSKQTEQQVLEAQRKQQTIQAQQAKQAQTEAEEILKKKPKLKPQSKQPKKPKQRRI